MLPAKASGNLQLIWDSARKRIPLVKSAQTLRGVVKGGRGRTNNKSKWGSHNWKHFCNWWDQKQLNCRFWVEDKLELWEQMKLYLCTTRLRKLSGAKNYSHNSGFCCHLNAFAFFPCVKVNVGCVEYAAWGKPLRLGTVFKLLISKYTSKYILKIVTISWLKTWVHVVAKLNTRTVVSMN